VHEVSQLNLSISSARSRLVQSPDRIKKHISEMQRNVNNDKTTLANFQRKGRELSGRMEIIGGLETDLKGLIDMSRGIEEQRLKVEDAKRALMALRTKLDSKDIESQTLITRTEQLQRQVQNAMDRHARSEASVLEMREKTGTRMINLKKEYDALSKQRTVVQRERDLLMNEQKELEDEMEAFVKVHEDEVNALMEEYWTLRGQAGTLHLILRVLVIADEEQKTT
jgi:kinetochore protein Nuf2